MKKPTRKVTVLFEADSFTNYSTISNKLSASCGPSTPSTSKKLNKSQYEMAFYYTSERSSNNALEKFKLIEGVISVNIFDVDGLE